MKIISIYNIKGGVGKTTLSVNLSYLSASEGTSSLIWDLDPQGSTSYYLCTKPKIKGTVKDMLKGKTSPGGQLHMTGYPNLELLPSDLAYRHMDELLSKGSRPTHGLRRFLKPMRKHFDHIFIDCPPGISLVTENVFQMSDILLVPLIPTPLSLRAYNRLVRFLVKNRSKKLRVMPFFNMVNAEKPIHRVVTKNVRSKHPIFLEGAIPESNLIEAMGVKRAPLFTFARESSEADDIRALWGEIKKRGGIE